MFAELWSKLDRVQQTRPFKIAATVVIVLAAIGVALGYWSTRPEVDRTELPLYSLPEGMDATKAGVTEEQFEMMKSNIARVNKSIEQLFAGRTDPTSVVAGCAVGAGVLVGAVWLGLGLTLVGFGVVSCVVVAPMMMWGPTRDWGRLLGFVLLLGGSFSVLMRLVHLGLSWPGPVFAVARNVLDEAVRLKLWLMFVVLLLFGLAALPGTLDAETPLRYRVQSFLQYGTAGAFWVTALLVVLLAVSTVSTEQRDKVIWQTMTKPVAAWNYILGKWLGIVGLAAVLMSVSGVGVFMFVEFLRSQPAQGEVGAFKTSEGSGVTPDRQWLETQILTARTLIENDKLDLRNRDPQAFQASIDNYIEQLKRATSSFDETDKETRESVEKSLEETLEKNYRVVAPGGTPMSYEFSNLQYAAENALPIIFRFRVDSGSNSPDKLYRVTFVFSNVGPVVREVPLGQYVTQLLPPSSVNPDGMLQVQVYNGAFSPGPDGQVAFRPNPEAISFPKTGLGVSYSVGSYRLNFARVVFVLWLKLAFLAVAGLFTATFLSFPVATLTTFVIFFAAESAGSITKALEVWDDMDRDGNLVLWRWVVVKIAQGSSSIFQPYAELAPVQKLVDGLYLSIAEVGFGSAFLVLASALLFSVGAFIFARRELAMYSGN